MPEIALCIGCNEAKVVDHRVRGWAFCSDACHEYFEHELRACFGDGVVLALHCPRCGEELNGARTCFRCGRPARNVVAIAEDEPPF